MHLENFVTQDESAYLVELSYGSSHYLAIATNNR